MGSVFGEVLPYAMVVAISPITIIAVILMLLAPKAGGTSFGFLLGWVAGILLATGIFIVLAATIGLGAATGGAPAGASWVKLLLGVLLLVLAVKQWQNRPDEGERAELPGWLTAIDKVTPVKAAMLGFLLSAVNPKNLMMCVAAGVTIVTGDHRIVPWLVFTILAASTVAIPVIAYAVNAGRMRRPLDNLKVWLEQNNATVLFMLLLVIGVVLLGKGLGGLF
ncbi:GAP family protein [Nonomuraea sp. NBC_01738]|uniref:GAP family protein n=1 Tax=Nonomuraea sp. NBC_01738 TaxID=2976003 RepID=UPI002E145498|nr:GAP family protein [Nonomuraea sp. NBC_01738]